MIGTLLREQLRGQRAALVWMTMLIAAAAGFATYSWTANLTDDALAQQARVLSGTGEYWSQAAVVDDHSNDALASDWGTPMTRDEVDAFIADANAEGAGLVASEYAGNAWVSPVAGAEHTYGLTNVQVYGGEVPWDDGLAEGSAPGAREIAIPASVAAAWGVGIGDLVAVGYTSGADGDSAEEVSAGTREVSGLVTDAVHWSEESVGETPAALSPGDPVVEAAFEAAPIYDWEGAKFAQVEFTWKEQTPATAAAFPTPSSRGQGGSTQASSATVLAAVLALGTVIAAVAVGRSQAQRRARWTATARALGAPRSAIAAATLAEGVLVGLVGGAVGLATGLTFAHRQLRHSLSAVTAPPDVSPAIPAATVLTAIGGGIALGLLVTAIPAALAARVTPASALKDVAAVDEAELSRRVRVWPVTVTALLGYLGMLAAAQRYWDPVGYWWFLGACAVTAVCGFALVVEASRRAAAWLGRSLSRRRAPAAVRAGLDLLAHPRQAAALMLVQFLAVASLVTVSSVDQMTDPFAGSAEFGWSAYTTSAPSAWTAFTGLWPGWAITVSVGFPVTVGVLLAAQALCATVVAGSRGLAASEEHATRALGLDGSAARWGEMLRHAVPQALGAVAGGLIAYLVAVPFAAASATNMYSLPGDITWAAIANAAVVAALFVVFALTVIGIGAAVTWTVAVASERTHRPPAPARTEGTR
ncbi:ABC transporter permease [Demequina sp. NBRC 110057]|uniref:ABC transporter permease n=1 Tax=Demequina sp. NBRC 110057 TaxID=1570346 RepID=UPI000A01324B|nr:ABC transporter permease [Demequina sp. NBRC 110057]